MAAARSLFTFSKILGFLTEKLWQACKRVNGVECNIETDNVSSYLKLWVILYADDTVIMSDNKDDLQHALNMFNNYCLQWKLRVNTSKTKIVIFSKGRKQSNMKFTLQEEELEIVDEYKYIGIVLSKSGSNVAAKKYIVEQANKAIFSLLQKIRNLSLPLDIQIDLFNKTIKPILLYGCEVWGIGNLDIIERVQLKFYKNILNLKKSTPSFMIYGELGVTPLPIDIKTRILSYWAKLIEGKENDILSSNVYFIMYEMHKNRLIKSSWIDTVKTTLNSLGFSGFWNNQSFLNANWLKKATNQRLKDIFIQDWFTHIDVSSHTNTYKIFKQNFQQRKYISSLPDKLCKIMLKFRTRNHHLPVETGRWKGVPFDRRICQGCQVELGYEFHYLFICPQLSEERKKYLKKYYYKKPNTYKFDELMNTTDHKQLKSLCHLISVIVKQIQ